MNPSLYFHTVRRLRWEQIVFRLLPKRSFPTRIKEKIITNTFKSDATWMETNHSTNTDGARVSFSFVNQRKDFLKTENFWLDESLPKLWQYNLHYFHFLFQKDLSPLSGKTLIQEWIRLTPLERFTGNEPYPTSLRICNWIKWIILFPDFSNDEMLNSLYLQTRNLNANIEYHLLANHLFENGKALFFAGIFFKTKEAETWKEKGLKILNRELDTQILEHGEHFEFSPMYHHITLVNLAEIYHILTLSSYKNARFKSKIEDSVSRMFEFAKNTSCPDGSYPLFNDSFPGGAPNFSEVEQYLKKIDAPIRPKKVLPPETGSMVVLGGLRTKLFADTGIIGKKYAHGHNHSDELSFHFWLDGQLIFTEAGCATYENNSRRDYERSSVAHNGLTVGGRSWSEVWSSFRVGRISRVVDQELLAPKYYRGSIRHSQLPCTWERRFYCTEAQLKIHDTIKGVTKGNEVTGRLHLAPGLEPVPSTPHCFKILCNKTELGILRIQCQKSKIKNYEHAQSINVLCHGKVIEYNFCDQSTVEFTYNARGKN